MHWVTLTFEQLSTLQLYSLLKLRIDVFVVEQQCPFHELDGHDLHPQTLHILGYHGNKLVAYARILPAGLTYKDVSIGRVLTISCERGKGYAHSLMQQAITNINNIWPNSIITISAQYHLRLFYRNYGFEEISAAYLEDGISHIDMQRAPCALATNQISDEQTDH